MHTEIIKVTPELLALIASGNAQTITPFTREIFLLDIVVAGTSFCKNIDDVTPSLTKGLVLRMQRDPANQYDENAIGIYYSDTRIGWVPAELNLIIARLMDAGKAFVCRIEDWKYVNQWVKINAKIYMVE